MKILNSVPVLAVRDPVASARYYTTNLDFEMVGESSREYAIVSLQDHEIHFHLAANNALPGSGYRGGVYFTVSDPDSLFKQFCRKEINILYPPQDRPYGMRDFSLVDPDGYSLCFGKRLS